MDDTLSEEDINNNPTNNDNSINNPTNNGSFNSNVFMLATKSIKTKEIIKYLNEFDLENKTHTDNITNPHGNEVFMFYQTDIKLKEDYIVDGFKWKNDGNKKAIPVNEPVIFVTYYSCYTNMTLPIGNSEY